MCCKASGRSGNSCPWHNNACKKVHCECIGSHHQQSSCEDCNNCKTHPCICEQRSKQCKKEKAICDCGMTCQQITLDCLHCSMCQDGESSDKQSICYKVGGKPEELGQQMATEYMCCLVCPQLICVCCKNCGEPDRGILCPKCQAIITDCNCVPQMQTQAQAGTLEPITKPPDMSVLRDRSQLEFYISALEK